MTPFCGGEVSLNKLLRKLFLILIAVLYFLPVGSLAAVGNWTAIRSANFHLAGDAGEDDIRAAANRLEEFRQVISHVFPGLKLDVPGVPTNVVVFKNAAAYRPFKPKRPDGTADDAISGYFQAGSGANYITLSVPDSAADRFSTILHEYVHFLVSTNYGVNEMPAWLNEGLAEYFETVQVNGRRVTLGASRGEHLRLLRNSELLPLSKLLGTDNASIHIRGDANRNIFYAQSWAVVHMMIDGLKRPDGSIGEEIKSIVAGRDSPEGRIRSIIGASDAEFDKGLRSFISRPAGTGSIFILPNPISFGTMASKLLSEAESDAYLADLLYYSNRDAEASEYVRRSLSANPKHAAAHGTLGLLKIRQEKFAEAKDHLELAAAAPEANAYVIFNYGYSLIRGAMNHKGEVSAFDEKLRGVIESALQRSIERAPEFAESYRMLAFVKFVAGSDLDEAATLVKKAAVIDPANDEHRLLLAQIYLSQEKYGEARAAAERLESLAADARIRNDASEILSTVREYFSAQVETAKGTVTVVSGALPPLILNKSAVSDAEAEAYELDRKVTNLNRILPKPKPGEKQITAYIERMRCFDDRIEYSINADGQRSKLVSKEFSDLRLSVITDGERTFQLECGGGFGKQLTVLGYRPPRSPDAKPELTAVTFVPDIFRFKSPAEMAKARVVVIIDDTKTRKP